MPAIISSFIIFFILLTTPASARCPNFSRAAEYATPKSFLAASRQNKARGRSELTLNLSDVSQARSFAFRFPALKELGFGLPNRNWRPYTGRLERSALHGKRVGWETSSDKGHARIRLDWDPDKGGHYNIEITSRKNGRSETHKLAVMFDCQGRRCTEAEVVNLARRLNN